MRRRQRYERGGQPAGDGIVSLLALVLPQLLRFGNPPASPSGPCAHGCQLATLLPALAALGNSGSRSEATSASAQPMPPQALPLETGLQGRADVTLLTSTQPSTVVYPPEPQPQPVSQLQRPGGPLQLQGQVVHVNYGSVMPTMAGGSGEIGGYGPGTPARQRQTRFLS